jgi:hypothetical protein
VSLTEAPSPGPPGNEGAPLRLAAIPHTGPYVDAVVPAGVVRVGSSGDPGPWLDPTYLAAHAGDLDVLHLHTGEGDPAVAGLEAWAETVRRLGVPLVVTVHELRNPGRCAGAEPDAGLEAVLATAEVVFTLTPGAADEIAARFGRTAIVVAHPSPAAPDPELGAERGLVGLRLGGSSPAAGDPVVLVRAALSGAVSGGGRLRVLADAADTHRLHPAVRAMAGRGELEVVTHTAADRPAQLQQLHVAVLPERCGTHSRDLEICRDVGTRVVAPACGWFTDQWSEVVPYGEEDPVSLTAAVAAALTRPMPRPVDRIWREEQREAVRRVHAEVYAQVAADRSWS